MFDIWNLIQFAFKRIYGLCLSLYFECNIFLDSRRLAYTTLFFICLFNMLNFSIFLSQPTNVLDIVHFRHYIKWQNRTMWLLKFILLDKKKQKKIFHFNIMSFCTDILDIHGSIILLMWYGLCYGGISFTLCGYMVYGDG